MARRVTVVEHRIRALIKYNYREIKSLLIAFGGLNLIIALSLYQSIRTSTNEWGSYDHDTFFLNGVVGTFRVAAVVIMAFFIIITIVQYTDIKNPGTYCFTASLPVRKESWLLSKLVIGLAMFLTSYIFMSLVCTVLYYCNYSKFSRINITSPYYTQLCQVDSLGNALIYLLYMYLLMIAVYLLFMLCQGLTGNIAAGLLLTAAILIAPRYILGTINNVMLVFNSIEMPHYDILHSISLDYLVTDVDHIIADDRNAAIDLSFVPARVITFTIINVIFGGFNMLTYARTDYSSQKLILNKTIEKIAILLTGIFAACLIPQINETKKHGFAVLIVLMTVVAVLTIFILLRYFRSEGKYDYLNNGKERRYEKI